MMNSKWLKNILDKQIKEDSLSKDTRNFHLRKESGSSLIKSVRDRPDVQCRIVESRIVDVFVLIYCSLYRVVSINFVSYIKFSQSSTRNVGVIVSDVGYKWFLFTPLFNEFLCTLSGFPRIVLLWFANFSRFIGDPEIITDRPSYSSVSSHKQFEFSVISLIRRGLFRRFSHFWLFLLFMYR